MFVFFLVVWLILSFCCMSEVITKWNDVMAFLSNSTIRHSLEMRYENWMRNFSFALRQGALGKNKKTRWRRKECVVFYPFSGCDVLSPISLIGSQRDKVKHIVMASKEPAVVIPNTMSISWLQYHSNTSFLAQVRTRALEVLTTSEEGFFLGHRIRNFAEEYGTLPLFMTVLGTLKGVWIDDVSVLGNSHFVVEGTRVLGGVSSIGITSTKSCFIIHYYTIDLLKTSEIKFLQKVLNYRQPITTIVKAVDEGGLLTHTQPVNEWEAQRRIKSQILADLLLDISSTIIQDVTGIHVSRLLLRYGSIDLYGFYLSPCHDIAEENETITSKEHAMAQLYNSTGYKSNVLTEGKVKLHQTDPFPYGHCMTLWPCHNISLTHIFNGFSPLMLKDQTKSNYSVFLKVRSQLLSNKLQSNLCHFIVAAGKKKKNPLHNRVRKF